MLGACVSKYKYALFKSITIKKKEKLARPSFSYRSEGLVSNKAIVELFQARGIVGMASIGADFYSAVTSHCIVFIIVVGCFYVEFHFFVHDSCNILQLV